MSTTASSPTYNHQNTITSSHSLPSSSSLNYYESIHQKSNLSSQISHNNKNVESVKTKRSLDKENTSPECEPFTIGEDAIKTFYSPGYPKEYTKNISCVRVIEGEFLW